jgi:hypothetical protein
MICLECTFFQKNRGVQVSAYTKSGYYRVVYSILKFLGSQGFENCEYHLGKMDLVLDASLGKIIS